MYDSRTSPPSVFVPTRPTQLDPRDRWDSSPLSGSHAYSRYRAALLRSASHPAPTVSRFDLLLAILTNVVTITCCFAPWIQYQTREGRIDSIPGTGADGVLLIASSVIAIFALACALHSDDAAIASTIGFLMSSIGVAITGLTLVFADDIASDTAMATGAVAGWGVVAAGCAALLATYFAFRVMHVARIY